MVGNFFFSCYPTRSKEGAFRNCLGLTTVTLGDGLEEIGMSAFYKCTSLHEIIIPNAVKTIKEKAFYGCLRLTSVTLIARG